MRISDWSSDVCSSDLEARRLLLHQQAVELSGPASWRRSVSWPSRRRRSTRCWRSISTVRRPLRTRGRHDLAQRGSTLVRVEIGRASCRERVCQYGLISVGAGPLKKKKNQKTLKKYQEPQ